MTSKVITYSDFLIYVSASHSGRAFVPEDPEAGPEWTGITVTTVVPAWASPPQPILPPSLPLSSGPGLSGHGVTFGSTSLASLRMVLAVPHG